jgi:hypothetical protein
MAEVTNLAEYRMKRRLKRAREWTSLVWCMCGEEFPLSERDDHHCLHPSQR